MPSFGFTLEQTAQVVGRTKSWVSKARARWLSGDGPPGRHGGRRRSIVAESEEALLVRKAIFQAGFPFGKENPYRTALRNLLEARSAAPVSESTVSAIMNRGLKTLAPDAYGASPHEVCSALAMKYHAEARLAGLAPSSD
mgnify:CR=1 FL=1